LREIHSVHDCLELTKKAAFKFADIIRFAYRKNFSALITQCIQYIDTHLYEKISLKDLAEYTHRAPAYLSSRFKYEVGRSVRSFITNKKIDEARHLLLFTDYTYQEISTLLNFTNYSYFIQCFKKSIHCTPKEFRESHVQYL